MRSKQIFSIGQYILLALMFTIILAMFGAVFYGLFTFAKYLGASNFGAVVQIFMLISSCGVIAERIKKSKQSK